MKYRPLGKSGIEASVVGFGAWAIGGWMWGGTKKNDPAGAIHAAIDHGINLIDTAPMYGYGHSEELVGVALKGMRDKVVLATKCGMVWYKQEGDKFFDASETGEAETDADKKYEVYINLRPAMIRHEIEQSLRRLKTDRIDLYQTHWQDSTTRTEDVMAELLSLKQEGKIRAIGCSNATVEQMERYQLVGQLDTDQEQYSMLQRQHEADNLPYCHDHQVAVLAYSPLALGILSGKIGPDHQFGEGDVRRGNPWYQKENRPTVDALLDVIQSVAVGKGLTIAQTVIAWTLQQKGCTHALVGARNPDQAIANAKAGKVELTEDEIRIIRKVVDQTKL
ncbi:MAG TPA: aldo/keto reductase [Chthoniobacterales bacterium]|nr:aldo/keto reductase [Chthoniobacterales bacterium]